MGSFFHLECDSRQTSRYHRNRYVILSCRRPSFKLSQTISHPVLAAFNTKFDILASSLRVANGTEAEGVDFPDETFTPSLIDSVKNRYQNFTNVLDNAFYEEKVDGKKDWVFRMLRGTGIRERC